MAYGTSELNCPYCHRQLTGQEIEYIQKGTTVRCRGCTALLTHHAFDSLGGHLAQPPAPTQSPVASGPTFDTIKSETTHIRC